MIYNKLPPKFTAWLQLIRFDKPIGSELLLYPTVWTLFLASYEQGQLPSWKLLIIFGLGVLLMRSAGCAINDFADRRVDGQVKRTQSRPLADGRLSPKTAVLSFVGLSLVAASLLLFLPKVVLAWAMGAVVLAFIYPFMKRYTHLPQVVLAIAFGFGVLMAYVAVIGAVSVWAWALFGAFVCWTVAYDTQYAMCDRDDDVHAGIKSTAIFFGHYDVLAVGALQSLFTLLMAAVFWHYFGGYSLLALLPVVVLFFLQYQKFKTRERMACFYAFLDNVWVGRYIFLAVAVLCVWQVDGHT